MKTVAFIFLFLIFFSISSFATLTANNAEQYRADTGAVIPDPSGTVPAGVGVYFDCAATDTTGATIQMQVELQQLPATFTGTPNYSSSFVASGTRPRTSTATGLTAGNYGWRFRVVNSSGVIGTWVPANNPDFIVQAATTPSISSVNPASPIGSNSQQPFTINGNNFVSGCTVTLRDLTANQTFANRTISSQTSSQIVINPDFTTAADNWSVEVINPGNASSGQYDFTVQTPTVTPSISSVNPASPIGSNSQQPFTINGNNFVSGCTVTLRDLTANQIFANRTISSQTSSQIVINPDFTTAADNWSVEVINPGNASSGQYDFTVQAPTVTPSISGVSPNPVIGSNSGQTFTVNGSGFISGAQVELFWPAVGVAPAGNATLSATFVNSSQLQVSATFGNDPATWTAQVINPGSVMSSTFSFPVQAPAPVITSLSPSSATAGGSSFTLTVNGITFDQSSVILWNGTSLSTSHTVSSGLTTAISATIPAGDIASTGSAMVTVYTPSPGGGTSPDATFTINAGTQTETLGGDFNTGGSMVSWTQENSGGRTFAFIKATQDNINNHPLPSNMSDQPSDFPVGMFDYADPDDYCIDPSTQTFVTIDPSDSNAVTNDAKAEADFFYQTAKPYLTAGNLLPAIDLEDEEGNGGFTNTWTTSPAGWSAMASWVNAWTEEFQTHMPGVYPILYMTQSYAGNLAPLLDQSKYKLWVAIAGEGTQYSQPVIPPSGDSYWNPTIWPWVIEQYQTTDTVYPPDLDVLNPSITLSSLEISGGGSGASSPMISSPKLIGTTFTLSVPTQIGFNYTLEYKNSFSDANWTAVQTVGGTGGTIIMTDTGATGSSRIYHVHVQ